MKRSSGPHKTANLSESLHQRLNAYALAASAAGVSMLALAPPSEAKIVYTPAHVKIGPDTSYKFNFGPSGPIPLFTLLNSYQMFSDFCVGGLGLRPGKGSVAGSLTSSFTTYVYALRRGSNIGPTLQFEHGSRELMVAVGGIYSYYHGPWLNVTNHYLGVRFQVNGHFHYGWLRLSVKATKATCKVFATLTGYAYETIPDKPITAGRTQEHAEMGNGSAPPNASLTVPTAKPATLGMLAMGSQGLGIWRREDLLLPAG
jgi:hypothetical protein